MAKVNISMRDMLEAGVHFGHQTRHWSPKMSAYLFGSRNKIHIINLEKTLPLFYQALDFVERLARKNKSIIFVGTKRAAQQAVQQHAERCEMHYVNQRWLGGLLTNYSTVKKSVLSLKKMEAALADGDLNQKTKKEQIKFHRQLEKLQRSLSGIKNMPQLPDALFVVDVGYEKIAVNEADKLGIPVIGVVDSNSNPAMIDHVIPGNDDSIRAINLYCSAIADTILHTRSLMLEAAVENRDDFVEIGTELKGKAVRPAERRKTKTTVTVKKMTKKKSSSIAEKAEKAITPEEQEAQQKETLKKEIPKEEIPKEEIPKEEI